MKLIIAILITVFSVSTGFGQVYSGTIYLKNNEKIESREFILKKDVVKFKHRGNRSIVVLEDDSIDKIEIDNGNYAVEGAAIGFLGSVLYFGAFEPEIDTYGEFLLVFLGSGTFCGLVGTLIPRHYTIHFSENDNFTFLNDVKLIPELNQMNYTLINYSIRF